MNSLLETATGGLRRQLIPIDCADDTGLIALKEWRIKAKSLKLTHKDLSKVAELSSDDWIQLLLYLNKKGLPATKLIKELFLLCQRTGVKLDWKVHHYGPYSEDAEKSLNKLESKNIISVKPKLSRKDHIYKLHTLNEETIVKELWSMLPKSFRDVLTEIVNEFSAKDRDEVIHYIYSAYPEFAADIKQQ